MHGNCSSSDFDIHIEKKIFDLLIPYRCPFCGVICERPACKKCLEEIEFGEGFCLRCGYPHAHIVKSCPGCRGRKLNFTSCRSLGFYSGSLKAAVHAVKFEKRYELAAFLVSKLLERSKPERLSGYDGVIYVPASRERLSRFGFDQSLMLAEIVAKELSLPVLHIVRRKFFSVLLTRRQTLLSFKERRKQAAKKYEIKEEKVSLLLERKKLILMDDVITTGSTVSLISAQLRQKGVKKIHVLVLAHTPQGLMVK